MTTGTRGSWLRPLTRPSGAPSPVGRGIAVLLALFALGCGGPGTTRVKPELVPPAETLDFGKIPVLNTKEADVPIQDVGRGTLNVSNVKLKDGTQGFALRTSPTAVESGQTIDIILTFTPAAEQTYTDTLEFDTDDAANPHYEVTLTGEGSTKAVMEVDPSTLDFGRVGECSSALKSFTITSAGTADLIVNEISFVEGSSSAFSFVGSTTTPATVKAMGANGLPGQIQITVKYTVAAGDSMPAQGQIRIRGTDPDHPEVLLDVTGTPNRAPVATIAPLGNGAPGITVDLDGSASMDPDSDNPLTFSWTLRSKPLSSGAQIAQPDQSMTTLKLDDNLPGAYEVQLDVLDATGVKSCQPARATVVATPAQKLLVEMYWDNSVTDLDLHVLRTTTSKIGMPPDDCFYANPAPDWGVAGTMDDPKLLLDALTGYGPEVFGYVNPVDTTYRVAVQFASEHLSTTPASTATVRIYLFGVVKAEFTKTLMHAGDTWAVADVTWPSGDITGL